MLRLYVPVAVTVLLIGGLTFWESIYSDRFRSSSVTAEEFGKRFANVPTTVGVWEGTDRKVDEKTLEVAGAVNHVARAYKNPNTGQEVDVWLVVGHARDIGRHTPDVCYAAQGFTQDGEKLKHRVEAPGQEPATFFTARFRREDQPGAATRVFWAWNANEEDEHEWVAPDYQRIHFGNNTALYKLYFTSNMKDRDEPAEDSVAMEFAKLMLPEVNRALFPELYGKPAATDAASDAPATEAASGEPASGEPAAAAPAASADGVDAAPNPAAGVTPAVEPVAESEDATAK